MRLRKRKPIEIWIDYTKDRHSLGITMHDLSGPLQIHLANAGREGFMPPVLVDRGDTFGIHVPYHLVVPFGTHTPDDDVDDQGAK